jgi:hypothetical protein
MVFDTVRPDRNLSNKSGKAVFIYFADSNGLELFLRLIFSDN